jgi:hypothetical protein
MSKEFEEFGFRFHGNYDISSIKKHLDKYHAEWLIDTSRQDISSVHRHTNSIFVYDVDASWIPGNVYKIDTKTDDQNLIELLLPIINKLEKYHSGKVGKVVFIKLPPFKNVDKHKDFGGYLESVRRHHIPIVTNEKVSFIIDGEKQFMDIGEIWEVNNNKMHQVWNEGDTDRVHLLIDIMPNDIIGDHHV